jgi:hypothetical protein
MQRLLEHVPDERLRGGLNRPPGAEELVEFGARIGRSGHKLVMLDDHDRDPEERQKRMRRSLTGWLVTRH